MKNSEGRCNHIIILRVLFTFGILIFHYNFYLHWYVWTEGFFFISGYLLAKEAEKRVPLHIYQYAKHRIKKLYPYYLFAIVMYFLAENIKMGCSLNEWISNFKSAIPQFLCFQMLGFSQTHLYNEPGWYVSALLCTSIIIYSLIIKIKKKYLILGIPAAVMIYIYFWLDMQNTVNVYAQRMLFVSAGFWRALAGMSLGVAGFYIKGKIEVHIKERYKTWLIYMPLLAVVVLSAFNITQVLYEMISIICIYISVVFGFMTTTKNYKDNCVIQSLEQHSYELYLNQAIIMWVICRKWIWVEGITFINGVLWIVLNILYTYLLLYIFKKIKLIGRCRRKE